MTGSIQGFVISEDLEPVSDATVVIAEGPGEFPDIASLTDEAGSFALDGLVEGEYLLRAFGPESNAGEEIVHVIASAVTEAEIVLRASE